MPKSYLKPTQVTAYSHTMEQHWSLTIFSFPTFIITSIEAFLFRASQCVFHRIAHFRDRKKLCVEKLKSAGIRDEPTKAEIMFFSFFVGGIKISFLSAATALHVQYTYDIIIVIIPWWYHCWRVMWTEEEGRRASHCHCARTNGNRK